jgi:hypothetical protein
MNPKPAYYNKAKAKEARRMMRQNDHPSAIGGTIYIDETGQGNKGRTTRSKTRKNQKPIPNEPIL